MMKTWISVALFSPGQITGIVLVSVLLAALIALNVYIAYLIHKRGVHRMHTEQLQRQRNELLHKLDAMRAGTALTDLPDTDYDDEDETVPTEDEESDEDGEVEAFGDDGEDEGTLEVEVNEAGNVVRYNRSFTARITQADNDLKARYSELKNYLLAFRGVRARMSWRRETFHIGRKSVAGFVVRGKTLCLCLATDPALFENTKYKVVDVSGRKGKNPLPCMYKLTSDRKMSYAKELADIVLAGFNTAKVADYKPADFTLPYKSTDVLIKRRLIKVVGSGIPDTAREDAMAAAKGIHYNRSFAARIIQSDDALKGYYSKLKNYLLAHKDVAAADSWKRESFRQGRNTLAAFVIRGKTLCLCLATDPAAFTGTKYKVEDLSKRSKNVNTPLLYRVKGDRRVTYAMQLIDRVFAEHGVEKAEIEYVNYAVPFTATETLVRRGLIRVTESTAPNFRTLRDTAPVTADAAPVTAEAAATVDDVNATKAQTSENVTDGPTEEEK